MTERTPINADLLCVLCVLGGDVLTFRNSFSRSQLHEGRSGSAILDRMLKRVISLWLALAVAGAPVVLEACRMVCASAIAHPAMTHMTHEGGHTCHDDAAKQGLPLFHAPQACDHGGNLPSTLTVAATRDSGVGIPLVIIVTSTPVLAPLRTPAFWTALASRAHDTAGHQVAVPLRI